MRNVCAALSFLFLFPIASEAQSYLPGRSFSPSEVYKVVGRINADNGAPKGHGTLAVHQGELVVIFSKDSGAGAGGFAFYDLSNPRVPRLVHREESARTETIREAHGFGFSRFGNRDLVALQTTDGLQIWDWTDHRSPQLLSHLKLPGIERSDYAMGAWWISWQAPYLYLGGSGNGLYIVDTSDPRRPKLAQRGGANPIPTSQLGGFRVGPVFAFGNLLVLTSMDERGISTLDIGDPLQPRLLYSDNRSTPKLYSAQFNGGKLLGAGADDRFYLWDLSTPASPTLLGRANLADKGGYVSFQDGHAFVGASKAFTRINMSNPRSMSVVKSATSGVSGRDEDFATALGNMTFISDDHGNGTFIMPHQAEPDTRAPEVNAVSPRHGMSAQPTLSRIGISFTDQIDLGSLHASSIILRPVNGGDPVPGIFSVQTNLVSFSPARRLRANTQYELILPAGGVKDISGNALQQEFRSVFTTGASRTDLAPCELEGLEPTAIGAAASFPLPRVPEDASVTWTFGDGSAPVKFEEPQSASHAYSASGRYTVRFEAKRGEESVSCSAVQIVHAPLLQERPRHTSSVAIDAETGWAWTVNPDQNSVSAIDMQSGDRILEVPVGLHPRTLAIDQRGRVFVISQDSALLTVLDSSSGRKLQERALPRGSRPYGVVVSHEGNTVAVTLEDLGEIAFLDAQSLEILARKPTGASPRAMALGPDGRLFVARFISSDLGGEIREWDIHTFQQLGVHGLAIDQTPDGEDKGRGLPNYVTGIAMTPDGARLFAPSKKDNILRGKLRDGLALTFENSVRTIVSQLVISDPANVREDLAARRDLNDRDSAVAVVFSPAGDLAYVATQGSNTVEVLDAQSGALLTAIENTGLAPQGLALSKDGLTLVVQNFLSRDLLFVDVSGLTSGKGAPFRVLKRVSSISRETLTADVLLGKQIFYNARDRRMSRDSYISCASCHVDGGHDGRTWDFTDRGEGLRNTTTLLGRSGMGHGRVHWSANFDEIQDFENDIRNGFGGTGFLKDSDWLAGSRSDTLGDRKAGLSPELDALAAYVTSLSTVGLSPYREQDGALSAGAQRGKQVFERLQCASCHSGSAYTDSASGKLHDVGTIRDSSGLRRGERLTGIDTPTLQGVWASAPYLHDGSAQGLEQAIEHGLKDREASTDERSDLIRYLLEIEGDAPKAPEAPQPPTPPSGPGPIPPMEAWIRNLTVTGKPWSQVALVPGQKLYQDRKFVVRSFPASLQGAALLQTHNDDKASTARAFAGFTLAMDAWVVIAFDERASTLPQWLQDWEQMSGKMLTDDTGRNLYRKRFSAGERVSLGGNAQSPMRGAGSHYQVIVLP